MNNFKLNYVQSKEYLILIIPLFNLVQKTTFHYIQERQITISPIWSSLHVTTIKNNSITLKTCIYLVAKIILNILHSQQMIFQQ